MVCLVMLTQNLAVSVATRIPVKMTGAGFWCRGCRVSPLSEVCKRNISGMFMLQLDIDCGADESSDCILCIIVV